MAGRVDAVEGFGPVEDHEQDLRGGEVEDVEGVEGGCGGEGGRGRGERRGGGGGHLLMLGGRLGMGGGTGGWWDEWQREGDTWLRRTL